MTKRPWAGRLSALGKAFATPGVPGVDALHGGDVVGGTDEERRARVQPVGLFFQNAPLAVTGLASGLVLPEKPADLPHT